MHSKVLGLALIVIGIALIIWGYNIYDSASSQLSRAVNGESPIEAWAGMVGGSIGIVLGLLRLK